MHHKTVKVVTNASDNRVNSLPRLQRLEEYYKTTKCINDTLSRMNKEFAEGTEASMLLDGSRSSTKLNGCVFSRESENYAKSVLQTPRIGLQNGSAVSFCDMKSATEKCSEFSALVSSRSSFPSVHGIIPTANEFVRESEVVKPAEEKGFGRASSFVDSSKGATARSSTQSSSATDGTVCSTKDLASHDTEESVLTTAPEDENKLFAEAVYLSHDEKEKNITHKLSLFPVKKKKKGLPYPYRKRVGNNRGSVGSSRETSGLRNSSVFSASSQERSDVVNLPFEFKKLLRRVNQRIEREFEERKDSSFLLFNSSKRVKLNGQNSPDRQSQNANPLCSASPLY